MVSDEKVIGERLNIIMGAKHLSVLKAGYGTHRSWWRRLVSLWRYVPLETWTVAYFTETGSASDYIEWAASTGPRPYGHRFRTDSVLAGFDRAWIEPFFTRVVIDPQQHSNKSPREEVLRLVTKDNI